MTKLREKQAHDAKWPAAAEPEEDLDDGFGKPKKTCLDRSERFNGFEKESAGAGGEPEIVLTEQQEAAVDALSAFVRSERRAFLLKGYAGTGKTTVLQHWLKYERHYWSEVAPYVFGDGEPVRGLRVAFAAPTNKATRVIFQMASAHGLRVPCTTVHKLLKLRVMSDAEKRYAARHASVFDERPMSSYDVVVVDECSMVGNRPMDPERSDAGLYDMLMAEAEECGTKIVFVGDPAQLPPVEDSESPAFSVEERAELTHVVRQAADSPILSIATWIRKAMMGEDPGPEPETNRMDIHGAGVMTHDPKEWLRRVVEAYRDEPNHPTKYKVIAARNAEVADINRHVRLQLLGPDAAPFEPEERLIATEPVPVWERGSIAGTAMTTDEEAIVVSAERARHPRFPSYKAWDVELELDGGLRFRTYIVDPSDRRAWESDIENIGRREAAGLRRFWMKWELNDAFGHLQHHYAMTVHRAQGSTYETVFVDSVDIKAWRDEATMARLLYTAITRPRKGLHLCG